MIFKCKYCGANLEITPEASVITCNYCDTPQAIPNLDDEKRGNLYDRANHFRRINEYDKASGFYEKLLNEDHTDAEAYWSLALCRYGIEFVDDPKTHRKIPTINRMQYTSFLEDADYLSALKYADVSQKMVYEEFGKEINRIQKGILEIAKAEEPFDIFICYKETDDAGRRTQDSVLAQEMYNQLTKEGYKVFFSRITLEDKIGSAYEPYIFAALNSAKAMIVVGTKPEHFNALWVKNEWSRYLYQIKEDPSKVLIPAYKDMDAYALPEELTYLQALDMSKLGFMQDLVHGINKISLSVKEKNDSQQESGNIDTLVKRINIFLDDREWKKADEYCEKILDIDPEYGDAYLGKLYAKYKVRKSGSFPLCNEIFSDNAYNNAKKYGDKNTLNCLHKISQQMWKSYLDYKNSCSYGFEMHLTEKNTIYDFINYDPLNIEIPAVPCNTLNLADKDRDPSVLFYKFNNSTVKIFFQDELDMYYNDEIDAYNDNVISFFDRIAKENRMYVIFVKKCADSMLKILAINAIKKAIHGVVISGCDDGQLGRLSQLLQIENDDIVKEIPQLFITDSEIGFAMDEDSIENVFDCLNELNDNNFSFINGKSDDSFKRYVEKKNKRLEEERQERRRKKLEQLISYDKVIDSIGKKYAEIYKIPFISNNDYELSQQNALDELLNSFDSLIIQKNDLEKSIKHLESEIQKLNQELDNYGIFAIKEKKEVNQNLIKIKNEISKFKQKLREIDSALSGFSNKEEIRQKLYEIKVRLEMRADANSYISEVNERYLNEEYSLNKAIEEIHNNEELYDKVCKNRPDRIEELEKLSLLIQKHYISV